MALKTVRGRVFTVDSSKEWLDNVRQAAGNDVDRLTCLYVDIGSTGEGGAPIDQSKSAIFQNYYLSPWNKLDPHSVDLFLIDGRFRVQSFLQAAIHCRKDAILLIHDYASRRFYHIVERVARRIAQTDDIAAFVAKDISKKMADDVMAVVKDNPF